MGAAPDIENALRRVRAEARSTALMGGDRPVEGAAEHDRPSRFPEMLFKFSDKEEVGLPVRPFPVQYNPVAP